MSSHALYVLRCSTQQCCVLLSNALNLKYFVTNLPKRILSHNSIKEFLPGVERCTQLDARHNIWRDQACNCNGCHVVEAWKQLRWRVTVAKSHLYKVYKQRDKHNCHFPKYFEKLEHTRLKVFTASETFEPLGLLPKIKKLSCQTAWSLIFCTYRVSQSDFQSAAGDTVQPLNHQ